VRLTGTLLSLGGLVLLVVGLFMGCGSLFTWNGRHPIDVQPLTPGTPTTYTLRPALGRRYTIAVHVVFDRAAAEAPIEGAPVSVSAKLPIVARVSDSRGATVAETKGWIDPEEPPTVLYGTHPSPREVGKTELVAERLVGSFPATSRDPFDVRIDLGPDRTEKAKISETRFVVYDDVTPPSIRRALGAAAVGGVAFLVGMGILFAGFFRGASRRGGKRRR
jgi:hypothetical protein